MDCQVIEDDVRQSRSSNCLDVARHELRLQPQLNIRVLGHTLLSVALLPHPRRLREGYNFVPDATRRLSIVP